LSFDSFLFDIAYFAFHYARVYLYDIFTIFAVAFSLVSIDARACRAASSRFADISLPFITHHFRLTITPLFHYVISARCRACMPDAALALLRC